MDQSTITWNNQPGSIGAALGTFNAAQAIARNVRSWNVTLAVSTLPLQQMALFSILFRATTKRPARCRSQQQSRGRRSREFQQGTRDVSLDVQFRGLEPASLLLLATGLAGAQVVATVRRQGPDATVAQVLPYGSAGN